MLYAISFLKGTALEWFQPGILDAVTPSWLFDWDEFEEELITNFEEYDLEGHAEAMLDKLRMRKNQRAAVYLTEFAKWAAYLQGWGQDALRHRLYDGLPERLKDDISRHGKPRGYSDMRRLIQRYDARYWERQSEIKRTTNSSKADSGKASGSNNASGNNSGNQDSQKNKNKPPAQSSGNNSNNTPKNNTSSGTSKPNNNSGNNSTTPKPDLSGKLGKDGKLTPEERKRRLEKNLCLFCGRSGHQAKDCTSPRSSAQAQAKAAKVDGSPASGSSQSKE